MQKFLFFVLLACAAICAAMSCVPSSAIAEPNERRSFSGGHSEVSSPFYSPHTIDVSNNTIYTGLWNWSPKGSYHNAVVHIRAGNNGGTGVLISSRYLFDFKKYGGLVLTADHVTRGYSRVTVTFGDGYKYTGAVVKKNVQADVSAITLYLDKDRTFIPVATTAPKVGDILEYCGFGGPGDKIRHFLGKLLKVETATMDGETYFLNGDSGGPVLTYNNTSNNTGKPHLTGIISGGYNTRSFGLIANGSDWKAHYPGRTCNLTSVQKIVHEVQCSPYGGYCPPQRFGQPQIRAAPGFPGPIQGSLPEFTPPLPSPIQKPDIPGVRPVQPPLEFKIGKVEIGDAKVEVKREENVVTFNFVLPTGPPGPAGIAGLPGPAGSAGPAGPTGPPGVSPEIDYDLIKTIIKEVIEDTGSPTWSHLILMAPEDAEYWPRLQNSYFRAQDYYDDIRHVEPPDKLSVGPMPLLVAYSGGKAVNKWIGLREVETVLNNLVRGEYDEFIR